MRIPLPSQQGDHQCHRPVCQKGNGSGNVGGVIIHAVVHHVGCKGDERSSSHGGPGEAIGSAGKGAGFVERPQCHDFHEGPEHHEDEFRGGLSSEEFHGAREKDEVDQKGHDEKHAASRPGGRQRKSVDAVDSQGGAGKAEGCQEEEEEGGEGASASGGIGLKGRKPPACVEQGASA